MFSGTQWASSKQPGLDRLEEAYVMHDPGLVYLLTEPGPESLYQEERFRALVERVGLASNWRWSRELVP